MLLWGATQARPIHSIGLGLLLLGGSALVGGVLGLLFGIPKSRSEPATTRLSASAISESKSATAESAGNELPTDYAVNTNLEQISDWLTKIIVGVSLTQLPAIRDQFHRIANYFGNGFAGVAQNTCVPNACDFAAPVIAATILVYGLAAGFLAGYLITRMFLPGAFGRVERELRELNAQKTQLVVEKKQLANENQTLAAKVQEEKQLRESVGSVQSEIYGDLYRYDQQGFRDAINKLDQLLKSDDQKKNPALWTYLAAAHGQAWHWENSKRGTDDLAKVQILKMHRDSALDAIKNALKSNDEWKPILRLMWDKDHPLKKDGAAKEEDDLEDFYGDADFRWLLGT